MKTQSQITLFFVIWLFLFLCTRCKAAGTGEQGAQEVIVTDYAPQPTPAPPFICGTDEPPVIKVICPTPGPAVWDKPTKLAVLARTAQDQHRTDQRKHRQSFIRGFIAVSISITLVRW